MFEIAIKAINPQLIDIVDVSTLKTSLLSKIDEKKFLTRQGRVIDMFADGIMIRYYNITPTGDAVKYIIRFVENLLWKLGLSDLFKVDQVGTIPVPDDYVINNNNLKSDYTKNTITLQNFIGLGVFTDEEIPEKYKCSLTSQLMDTPVYIASRPELKFDKKLFLTYIYMQSTMQDPYTRININPNNDVKIDFLLKEEIREYVSKTFNECLTRKADRFKSVFAKYLKSEINQDDIDKAFRMAAASNNAFDMDVLCAKISSVNAQDKNPKKRYTALHWAIKHNAVEAVKLLTAIMGTELNIKDANGETAIDLAKKSNNSEIRDLIFLRVESPNEAIIARAGYTNSF